MKTPFTFCALTLLVAASYPLAARAQTAAPSPAIVAGNAGTLQQFLSGDLVPLDLKFSQMGKGWSRVTIERKGEADKAPAELNYSFLDPFAGGFQRYFGLGQGAVWTQGRTVDLNNQQSLVVYSAQFPPVQEARAWFDAHRPKEIENPALSQEKLVDIVSPMLRQFLDTVPLRASLVSVDTIGSLQDVQTFDYERAFAAFQQTGLGALKADVRDRDQRRMANSRVSLNMLAAGLKQYALDYDETLPSLDNWSVAEKALQPYVKGKIELAQPGQKLFSNPLLSKKKMAHLAPYKDKFVVFYSGPDADANRWVVMLNGDVNLVSDSDWSQLKKASRLP